MWHHRDISMLRLLQIVHRHGDRSPTFPPPNDPFQDISKYWVEGVGELTKGKYRMYKLGEFIRQEFKLYCITYLGGGANTPPEKCTPGVKGRYIESISNLLCIAYPSKQKDWQW